MKKTMSKRIIGLFIILFIFTIISPLIASAKDEKTTTTTQTDKCTTFNETNKNNLYSRYGAKLDYNADTNQLEISMNIPQETTDVKKSNVKFKIAKIEYTKLGDKNKQVLGSFDNDVAIAQTFGIPSSARLINKSSIKFDQPASIPLPVTYYATLVPDGFEDPQVKKNCGDNYLFSLELVADVYGQAYSKQEEVIIDIKTPELQVGGIDCNNYAAKYAANSFDYKFCNMKERALAAGDKTKTYTFDKDKDFGSNGESPNTYICDPNDYINSQNYLIDESDDTQERDYKDKNYYREKNTNYLMGTTKYSIDVGEYTYNYGGQKDPANGKCTSVNKENQKTEKIKCEIQCEEVVSVDYGAPVASKAGLCFQYKVKVESRVNCSPTVVPQKPQVKTEYCTPSPGCNHGNGFIDKIAGPSEEFDSCINSCDGGSYSKKCTKKCYNSVYKTNKSSKKTSNSYDEVLALKVKQYDGDTITRDGSKTGVGKYIRDAKGTIIWQPPQNLGRWYLDHPGLGAECTKTDKQGGGISAVCGCGAVCRWNGCKGDVYLNPGEAQCDATANVKVYENAMAQCQAKATCTTTQAEFKISVDYTYGDENKKTTKTINFPYEKGNDDSKVTFKYDADTKARSCSVPGGKENTTILRMAGCYQNDECAYNEPSDETIESNGRAFYFSEWTFPGTYIHNKTGEISYRKPKTDESKDWISQEHKYCIPLDQVNINEEWWIEYYRRLHKDDTSYSFNNQEYISNVPKCKDGETPTLDNCVSETTFSTSDVREGGRITPNIHASTENFGYFKWDINIECFYGISEIGSSSSTSSNCNMKCIKDKDSKEQMRVRSVDLANLFPASDGEKLNDPTTTGRSPGFNWSEFAQNTKDSNYISSPKEYAEWVQTKQYSIYTEDELDYDITLTKENIKNIKNAKKNYTDFEGDVESINSVTNYKSPIIRNNTEYATVNKKPEGTLKCNNIKGNSCFDVHSAGQE